MAVRKITLYKEFTNSRVDYIYPKTSADIVEYNNTISVKDKIDELEYLLSGAIVPETEYVESFSTKYKFKYINYELNSSSPLNIYNIDTSTNISRYQTFIENNLYNIDNTNTISNLSYTIENVEQTIIQ